MGLLNIFKPSIKIGGGLTPMGKFPLMEAHDIVVDEDGTRLDDKLNNIVNVDETLTQKGQAADAKAVGDRITDTVGNIESVLKRL